MSTYTVGYFVGSLARASINRKLVRALTRLAPPELEMREIPIGELPLYSYDYDADYPPPARALKEAIAAVDAVLFVTPEYNRSIPGALKNAIDWGSRPWGQNSFARKPSAMIGTSPGMIGTAVGQQHLKSILSFCNSPQMNAIEAYIQFTPGLITDDGGHRRIHGRVPPDLHDGVPRVHHSRVHGATARRRLRRSSEFPESPCHGWSVASGVISLVRSMRDDVHAGGSLAGNVISIASSIAVSSASTASERGGSRPLFRLPSTSEPSRACGGGPFAVRLARSGGVSSG